MVKFLLRKIIDRHKGIILHEAALIEDFISLLMKPRNTGIRWTRQEKKQLKIHVKHLALFVPALVVFLLPGGAFLLPVLAETLDRRKARRKKVS